MKIIIFGHRPGKKEIHHLSLKAPSCHLRLTSIEDNHNTHFAYCFESLSKSDRSRKMATINSNNLKTPSPHLLIRRPGPTRASSLPLSISGLGQSLPKSADNVKDSELRRVLAAQMERLSLSVCMVRLRSLTSLVEAQGRPRNHFKSIVTFFRLVCFHATF